jgi:hypothetical protein
MLSGTLTTWWASILSWHDLRELTRIDLLAVSLLFLCHSTRHCRICSRRSRLLLSHIESISISVKPSFLARGRHCLPKCFVMISNSWVKSGRRKNVTWITFILMLLTIQDDCPRFIYQWNRTLSIYNYL